jgi:glutathionylspermidine synthase
MQFSTTEKRAGRIEQKRMLKNSKNAEEYFNTPQALADQDKIIQILQARLTACGRAAKGVFLESEHMLAEHPAYSGEYRDVEELFRLYEKEKIMLDKAVVLLGRLPYSVVRDWFNEYKAPEMPC